MTSLTKKELRQRILFNFLKLDVTENILCGIEFNNELHVLPWFIANKP